MNVGIIYNFHISLIPAIGTRNFVNISYCTLYDSYLNAVAVVAQFWLSNASTQKEHKNQL